jgi:hypothetical protein
VNFAFTVIGWFTVISQTRSVPQDATDHPANVDPAWARATSLTSAPTG